MATAKKSEPSRWTEELSRLIASLDASQKQMRKLSSDPFAALRQLDSVRDHLKEAGIHPPDAIEAVKTKVEAACMQLAVEFWGLLSEACRNAGWELSGNTNRRLVNRAIFVSLEGQTVRVEGVPTGCAPFVPVVMKVLGEQLQGTGNSEADSRAFMMILSKAYDNASKSAQECSLTGC